MSVDLSALKFAIVAKKVFVLQMLVHVKHVYMYKLSLKSTAWMRQSYKKKSGIAAVKQYSRLMSTICNFYRPDVWRARLQILRYQFCCGHVCLPCLCLACPLL